MPDREANIRRLMGLLDADSADAREAARLGVSVAEYRRGKEIGVWRKGDGGPRRAGNAQLPVFKDEPAEPPFRNDQRLRRANPGRNMRLQSDRPDYRNDT